MKFGKFKIKFRNIQTALLVLQVVTAFIAPGISIVLFVFAAFLTADYGLFKIERVDKLHRQAGGGMLRILNGHSEQIEILEEMIVNLEERISALESPKKTKKKSEK